MVGGGASTGFDEHPDNPIASAASATWMVFTRIGKG